MGRMIPAEDWLRYQRLRVAGVSRRKAASVVGISYDSAKSWDDGESTTSQMVQARTSVEIDRQLTEAHPDKPIAYEDLGPEARRALEDFDYFRRRYFNRDTKPWQIEAAAMVVSLLESEEREWVVVNVPPGSGKSTTFTHDIPAWLIARNRGVRIMIGSRTQKQANQYSGRLRRSLMRVQPPEGAESTLIVDFGPFEPAIKDLWRREEFIVWQDSANQPIEKEPTVSAAGMDTGFLGGRFDFVIWDDLVDASTIRTAESREKQRAWYDDEAETRLEPGGLFVLQGQRLAPDDLYRYALDKPGETDESFKYRHVIFKAHYAERCTEDHGYDAAPYPDGCLLDPVRLGWRDLSQIKANNPRKFEIVMQQQDVDPAGQLVSQLWLEGGTDDKGHVYPGCYDQDRDLNQLPQVPSGRLISIATVDPSPTKWWAIQWWIYEEGTDFRYLMNLEKVQIDAPGFLDRVGGTYRGLAEDFQQISIAAGAPITTWVVEQNAAQRFMLQYQHVLDWLSLHSIDLIGHNTYANKSDPEFGVQSIGPNYRYGRVRLPYASIEARAKVAWLTDELTKWPSGQTDDQVMGNWFFEWQLQDLRWSLVPLPVRTDIPSWIKVN